MQTLDPLMGSAGKSTILVSLNWRDHTNWQRQVNAHSRLKQLLTQCMETASCTGEIDPSGVELKECGDKVSSGTGY